MSPLGVIVGRFQVPRPHAGHVELVTRVHAMHGRVLILVGNTAGMPCLHDPLPAELRVRTLQEAFPSVIVQVLDDQPTDAQWTAALDSAIKAHSDSAVIYGGRANSLAHYSGIHPVKTLDLWVPNAVSASEARASQAHLTRLGATNEAFLAGMIYAQQIRCPISYQAVDIAVTNSRDGTVLLGQKMQDDDRWRFPGGFVDPSDVNLERAALREIAEEVGPIGLGAPSYLGSFRIDDYRYRDRQDKILTALFAVPFLWGVARPADDLARCQWATLTMADRLIHPIHQPLLTRLWAYQEGLNLVR